MNYLAHFVFNHDVCHRPIDPYFALGVVLPDLWLRFSRTRRIRGKAVRATEPRDGVDRQLRDGLLNHAEVDRRFHVLPTFLRWQKAAQSSLAGAGVHPALADLLAHLAVELAIDHRLLQTDPGLVEQFYGVVAQCDPAIVAERVGVLGAVDTRGLDEVLRQFVARRFLRHYRTLPGLVDVAQIVLALAQFPAPPPGALKTLLSRAVQATHPPAVWAELTESAQRNVLAL